MSPALTTLTGATARPQRGLRRFRAWHHRRVVPRVFAVDAQPRQDQRAVHVLGVGETNPDAAGAACGAPLFHWVHYRLLRRTATD
jgi:hypothetical protein